MKKIIITSIILVTLTITSCIKSGNVVPDKTTTEIAQQQKDSLKEVRKNKIDFALTTLKEMIKKGMKNPDSYEMIDRIYDAKDTGNVVKLLIHFRGDNSFGGKASSTVFANYNIEKDNVTITKQVND